MRTKPGRFQGLSAVFAAFPFLPLILATTGCNSMWTYFHQPDYSIRATSQYRDLTNPSSPMAVVSDAIITQIRTKAEGVSLPQSVTAASNLQTSACRYLRKKGYEIVALELPGIGSSLAANSTLNLLDEESRTTTSRTTPINEGIHSTATNQVQLRDALARVMRRAVDAVSNFGEVPAETFRASPSLDEDLRLIAGAKGVRFLTVIVGEGAHISRGAKLSQSVGEFLVTAIGTLGTDPESGHAESYMDCYVGVIDLEAGELIWTQSRRIHLTPTSASDNNYWVQAYLKELPGEKSQAKKSK